MKNKFCSFIIILLLLMSGGIFADETIREYKIWYDRPAPDRGGVIPIGESDRPIDEDWERWSLPIGNGYMGASIFGGTNTERIQLTDKTMYIKGLWGSETHTSFGDLYIDFFHNLKSGYRRSLDLNKGIAEVEYDYSGVHYHREYFMSYPDNVLAIKLTANKPGKLSFAVRPKIAHEVPYGPLQRTDTMTIGYISGQTQTRFNNNGKEGKVYAENDMIILRGKAEYLNLIFEADIKVIPSNGKIRTLNDSDSDNGVLYVEKADSAVILFTLGTNYRLDPKVFSSAPSDKLKGFPDPHEEVSGRLENATEKGYDELKERHVSDFTSLFDRVSFSISEVSTLPTDRLLNEYKNGRHDAYLEELFFHYGRYLLISSARKGALPPTLQGVWNQYELAPWNGNYTHNINIQMNYWPAFNTNLMELFESYVDYYNAYKPMAEQFASKFIKKHHPSQYIGEKNDYGWTMGAGACAYSMSMPGGHSGPGVSAFTSKLFWDYYEFTDDYNVLRDVAYPAVSGTSTFLSKVVSDTLGYLLAYPSASPEQYAKATGKPYPTVGCAFDQQMIYENHNETLKGASILKKKGRDIKLFKKQMTRLDPVQIGYSGQIKEYREEKYYGDIVSEQHHRHISQLIGLYPGTLINSNTPAWLDAAKVTLNRRGDVSTGWSMAHKLNLWARTKDGNRAHDLLESVLENAVFENLWTNCVAVLRSPYQIDANFGTTAGVAEMLLQSHEGYIDLLPALPDCWKKGHYKGLTARGNFEVSAEWENGQMLCAEILSKHDNICMLHYPGIGKSVITDMKGNKIEYKISGEDKILFKTSKGQTYIIKEVQERIKLPSPSALKASFTNKYTLRLDWDLCDGDLSYNLYRTRGNNPDYELIADGLKSCTYFYDTEGLDEDEPVVFKVVTVDAEGNRGIGATVSVVKE